MKKIITLTITISLCINLSAQDINLAFSKHPWKGNNQFLINFMKKYPQTDTIYFKIPLTFWVYPNKNNFGPTLVEVKNQIQLLNYYFNVLNHTGLYFYLAQFNVIHHSHHQNTGYLLENFFISTIHHTKGTVNIHLVNNLQINLLFKKIYFGGTFNSLTNSIILTRSNFPTGLAHEIGHYFGLLHPHRHWNWGKMWAESVSRTRTISPHSKIRNCETRGDYLCDTPAEPNLKYFMDSSCHYTGHITDPWGQPYKPMTHNIMSYQPNKHCRKYFTPMQIAVMLYNVQHAKWAKYWKNSPQNIPFSPDNYEPDNTFLTSTLLKPNITQYHTFNLIFTAKHLLHDQIDFFRIYPNYNKHDYIIIKQAKHAFPYLKITIYDKYHIPIKTSFLDQPGQIKIPHTDSDVYYIRLQILNNFNSKTLYDYYICLKTFPIFK